MGQRLCGYAPNFNSLLTFDSQMLSRFVEQKLRDRILRFGLENSVDPNVANLRGFPHSDFPVNASHRNEVATLIHREARDAHEPAGYADAVTVLVAGNIRGIV